jgi:thiamine pyrophosphokinase
VADPPPTLEPDLGNASGGSVSQFVVVIGGSPPDPRVVARLPDDRAVIAADSGLDYCGALGLMPDLVVGDFDSVSADALAAAAAAGIPIERHPVAKDATDTEIALDAARARGATAITVVAGGGDRLDHLLSFLLLLAHPSLAAIKVEAWVGDAHVDALQGPSRVDLDGPGGAIVTLLPVHGPAVGVTTHDLRYPLRAETLHPGTSRGVSNELQGRPAAVSLEHGALLVIVPRALGGRP